MEFKYEIRRKNEKKVGTIEAENREEAAELLKKDGWFITALIEKTLSPIEKQFGGTLKISDFEKINFTDHLASMIDAGTSLREALEAYSEGDNKHTEMVTKIGTDIERGKKLSQALSTFPNLFNPLYLALVKAGEMSGSLDETLAYLANELRREYEFKQQVKSALFYPALVILVSIGVIIFVITGVIPRVSDVAKNMGVEMPLLTRTVVGISDFLKNNSFLVFGIIFAIATGLYFLLKDPIIRERIKKRLVSTPVIGSIMRKYILARLLRIIGSCIKYGIPLPAALDAAEEVVDNDIYKDAIQRINKKITKGESLANALSLEEKLYFPGIITRSIKGAEKTGTIDKTLHRLSIQYELEVDRDLKRATELLEPAMIVILGVIVLGIAISVIAPIYQLTSSFNF